MKVNMQELSQINKFVLANCDTDSIAFRKADNSFMSKEERKTTLDTINSLFPNMIRFADDGFFTHFIVLAAKNYIMKTEDGKVKLKGSSLKDSKLEPILKEMNNKFIEVLLSEETDNEKILEKLLQIYHSYVILVEDIKDIKPWGKKLTISSKTLTNERSNEANVRKAIEGTEYVEGDKVYTFYDEDYDTLVLVENFKGTYSKDRLYERLHASVQKYESILDMSKFLDYSLKRNKEKLKDLEKN